MGNNQSISKGRLYTSYGLQGLVSLMFLMGAFMNISQNAEAVKGATDMGFVETSVLYLGIILLLSTLLYIYPKTSILGALLLTAWLGGAVATHMIHKDEMSKTLAPVIFGVLVWVALWLREGKLSSIFPFKA